MYSPVWFCCGCSHVHSPRVCRALSSTDRWAGRCHLLTGGPGVADGTGAAAAPAGAAALRVRHCAGGGETLVDYGVSVITHLADDRVPALQSQRGVRRHPVATTKRRRGVQGHRVATVKRWLSGNGTGCRFDSNIYCLYTE